MQAAIIGAGADYIRNRNAEADTFTAHLRLVEHRMRYLRLPTNLRLRVVSFYEQLWSHHRLLTVDSDDLDAGLSGPLANDVRLVQYGRMLTKISFLQEGSLRLIERLQCILRPAHFVKNDTVCRAGDTGAWIGIVSRGHLGIVDPGSDARGSPGAASRQVPSPVAAARQLPAATQAWATKVAPPPGPAPPPLSREGSGSGSGSGSLGGAGRPRGGSPNLTTILHVGDHFGEYSFLIGEPRTSTVIAFGWVRLMTLHKEDWDRLGDDLPEDKAKIEVCVPPLLLLLLLLLLLPLLLLLLLLLPLLLLLLLAVAAATTTTVPLVNISLAPPLLGEHSSPAGPARPRGREEAPLRGPLERGRLCPQASRPQRAQARLRRRGGPAGGGRRPGL